MLTKQDHDLRIELLKKKSEVVIKEKLPHIKAQVICVLDISYSMEPLFKSGIVQRLVDRLLALSLNLDVDGMISFYLFGADAHYCGDVTKDNVYRYVEDIILSKYKFEGSTLYGPVMGKVLAHNFACENIDFINDDKCGKKPGFLSRIFGGKKDSNENSNEDFWLIKKADIPYLVIFITDGDNYDERRSGQTIIKASRLPVFWQFIGIGNSNFYFLEKLDTLVGRFIDNAGFFRVNDIDNISDDVLYNRLLTEFPSWIELAKKHTII